MTTRRATAILAEDEVRAIVARMRGALAADLPAAAETAVIEAIVRFGAVAAKCQERREERGGTIRGIAGLLKVPQRSLKNIEENRAEAVSPDVLARYVALLELEEWYRRWALANPRLAARLAASRPAPRRPR
jgi:hypothetical protein